MNPSADITKREIAVRDLLYQTLKHWRGILLFALIAGALCFALKMRPAPDTASSENASAEAYEAALEAYRTDKSSYETLIGRTDGLLVEKRAYLAGSLLTKIDPSRVAKATASVVFRIPEDNRGISAAQLADLYAIFCTNGADWSALSEELGTEPHYLAELISTVPAISSPAKAGDASAYGISPMHETLTVTVVHPEEETAKRILDELLLQLEEEAAGRQDLLGSHELIVASKSSGIFADDLLGTRISELLQELYQLSTNEERLNAQFAKLKKPSAGSGISASTRIKGALKYGLAGAAGGALFAVLLLMAALSLGGKFLSASEISRLFGLNVLAVIPDRKPKKSPADRLIARLDTEKKNGAAKEVRYRYAAERILGADKDVSSLLLFGDVPADELSACADDLRAALLAAAEKKAPVPEILIADSVSRSPEAVKALRLSDEAVLVCKIGVSSCQETADDLAAAKEQGQALLGIITL